MCCVDMALSGFLTWTEDGLPQRRPTNIVHTSRRKGGRRDGRIGSFGVAGSVGSRSATIFGELALAGCLLGRIVVPFGLFALRACLRAAWGAARGSAARGVVAPALRAPGHVAGQPLVLHCAYDRARPRSRPGSTSASGAASELPGERGLWAAQTCVLRTLVGVRLRARGTFLGSVILWLH